MSKRAQKPADRRAATGSTSRIHSRDDYHCNILRPPLKVRNTMTFDEYISSERGRYDRLAGIIESILVATLESDSGIRLQQTQRRAKSPLSLKRKLERIGQFGAHDIESHAKDLAGCRLIFYTNSDASKFLASGTVRDNFEVDWHRSKIHHPTSDAGSAADQFISNNYVVRLKDDRANLPEYSAVAWLWCEVQVQTIRAHASASLQIGISAAWKTVLRPNSSGPRLTTSYASAIGAPTIHRRSLTNNKKGPASLRGLVVFGV